MLFKHLEKRKKKALENFAIQRINTVQGVGACEGDEKQTLSDHLQDSHSPSRNSLKTWREKGGRV